LNSGHDEQPRRKPDRFETTIKESNSMMDNLPLRPKSFSAVAKGSGISSAKISEYHSALAAFSDATSTQAYDLILNDKNHVGKDLLTRYPSGSPAM
jgi:hypothetical protein